MRRTLDGILVLDKPSGITSNTALQRAKRLLGAAKAGHAGTLDPLASGVLPLLFGEATKFSSFLLEVARAKDVGARMEEVVTYHDSCHALRELRIKHGPRELLRHVRGLELREMDIAEECCGFGGTFSVKFAEVSGGMARTKVDSIVRTGASTVVSIDSSCLMQLQGALSRANLPVRTMHLAEVLACR